MKEAKVVDVSPGEIDKAKALLHMAEHNRQLAEKKEADECLEKVNAVLEDCGFAMIAEGPTIKDQPAWTGDGYILSFAAPGIKMVKIEKPPEKQPS